MARTFRVFDDDCLKRRIVRRTVPWEAAFVEAERLSRKFGISHDCRPFDLIHVAIAMVSDLSDFATLDDGQAELAKAAGLTLVDPPR